MMPTLKSRMTPLGESVIKALNEDTTRLRDAGFWLSGEDLELDSGDARGIYACSYFASDGKFLALYIGLSDHMPLRAGQHAAQLALDVPGLSTCLHYTLGRQACQRRISPLIKLKDQDEIVLLGLGEQFFCWVLGTFRLKKDLLEERTKRGLPVVPGHGANSTCDDSMTPKQRRYRYLCSDLVGRINHLVSLVISGAEQAQVAAARTSVDQVYTRARVIKGELLTAGEYLWHAPSEVVFGIRLPNHVLTGISFAEKPRCLLCLRRVESSASKDMSLAGAPEARAKYAGLSFSVVVGTQEHFLQCVRDPMPRGWTRLAESALAWLGPNTTAEAESAAAAKAAEVAARHSPDLTGLSKLARCGLEGTLLLKGFSCVSLPSAPLDYRFLIPKRQSSVLETALGYGSFCGARHSQHDVHTPPIRLRFEIRGPGSFDWRTRSVTTFPLR